MLTKVFTAAFSLLIVFLVPAMAAAEPQPDYLKIVRAYADAMIEHGRDVYGEVHSPLFAEILDRKTLRLPEGEAFEAVAGAHRVLNVRPADRMHWGGGSANPQLSQNLYQVLYALTEITRERRYADEADKALKYFFEHCQSPATGLLHWGDHSGWDLKTNGPTPMPHGGIHEFTRPWVLWERSWELAPEACRKFAIGLWEHQIGCHETGDFCRHARISEHGPGTGQPFARHGGFYIETWAVAYQKTKDPVFLKAIEAVLGRLAEDRREGGYIFAHTPAGKPRTLIDFSFAISLENAASKVPADLAAKLRKEAAANDEAFVAAGHGNPDGAAWHRWGSGYGGGSRSAWGPRVMLRYRQTQLDRYREVLLAEAGVYYHSGISNTPRAPMDEVSLRVWPGSIGSVVWLMLDLHELTGEAKYLDEADRYGRLAVKLFLSDGSPLPLAISDWEGGHYETMTNGDTLMMALLRLWVVQNQPDAKVELIFTDR